MASINNNPSHRSQATSVPHIHVESPPISDQSRCAHTQFDPDFSYGGYNQDPFMSSSTLFSLEGPESLNPQLSLEDLSTEGFYLGDLETSLLRATQSQDLLFPEQYPSEQYPSEQYPPEQYLSGPDPFASSSAFQVTPPSPPPQTMPQNTAGNMLRIPIYTPSPTSSYVTLSPSHSHESPSSPWSDVTTPSSEGSVSPMIPPLYFTTPSSEGSMSPMISPSGLSRRESSASLRHHHSPSDPSFGHTLYPPAIARHIRSRSESSTTRPVASQAMLEANQRRRRHDATYRCDECGQTFTAVFSLKRHAQSHSGVRPFLCNIPGCNQAFFNQSDCRRHEKSRKRHKGLPQTFSDSP